ncbi:multicopper oxidase-domain-containing protein [Aspergillus welwitschiae]|uniref:Multicopper oxidase-domain-containing protein n=1 Tax=Aspergillus welwitschiae TaxID=1341132 RepID=A0A3F3PV66_9EURO|nr:multicopper oxidase-domain-containing protein [Aspergillus welwitschiae]RDH30632.1 multicopper oxidase-domain-containing protein [Aspergillus welwitschiae]
MSISQSRLALLALCFVQWVSGRVVQFQLDLTYEDVSVAGDVHKAIVSNGQVPGPTLWLKQGDDVEFLVNNSMSISTTVHFHGIEQLGTPWSDGVPGLSQLQIQPGEQFLYKWKASQYGSYIYHSHTRAQIDDGLYGAIYIEPADSVERPFHLISGSDADEQQAMLAAEKNTRPVIISDWRAFSSHDILQIQNESGVEAYCANSVLINGKGSVICPSQEHINAVTTEQQKQILGNVTLTDMGCLPPTPGVVGPYPYDLSKVPKGFYEGCTPSEGPTEVFKVNVSSRYASFDLISMAGSTSLVFSIDEHPMYVYAVDGRYVEPLLVDAVTVPVAARYSVMVPLKSEDQAGDYTVRVANNYANQVINGTGVLSYDTATPKQIGSSQPYINEAGSNATATTVILNETDVVPFPVVAPAKKADRTYILNVENANSSYTWTLGNQYPMSNEELDPPVLFNLSSISQAYSAMTMNGTWVDLIINITTSGQPQHPIHKHSNKYFVIGTGNQPFIWSSVEEAMQEIPENINFENPQMRDTFYSPSSATGPSWLAMRYHIVNPGPFLLHCHLQMHHVGGLALALLDGVDAWPTDIPEGYQLPVMPI